MADYIFFRKSRNALSSFLHILLNLLLGIGSIILTTVTGSWIVGFVLVIISKWRTFAVRPRYLFLNLKSNLVDFIIGFSCILLTFYAGVNFTLVHWALAAFYTIWLIFIKPLSSTNGTLVQALLAIFLGTVATTILSSSLNSIFIVLIEFIIGYGASRHVLAQNGEQSLALMSLVGGLVFAEISWLCHSWIITYNFTILNSSIVIPQLAIFLPIIFFVISQVLDSVQKHDNKFIAKEIMPPIVFGVLVIAILLIGFSSPAFNLY